MALRNGTARDPAVDKDLQRIIEQPALDEADFWKLIRSADARTNVAIMNAAPLEDADKIRDAYRRAWRHIGSPVKMRSVTEQLESYEDIFESGASQTGSRRNDIRAWVQGIKDFIETEFPGVRPG